MRHTPHNHRTHLPLGLLAAGVVIVLLPITLILAWLGWQWQTLDVALPWLTMALRIALFTVPPTYVLALVWQRWGRKRYIDAYHITQLTKAQRAFPDALHSLSYHDSHKEQPAPPLALPEPTTDAEPPSVPTFAQLLDQGVIGPGRPLVLGYADGQPITGSWNDLYSCGIGGMTGSGKSWAIAFLAGQSAAAGARIILIDPHAGDPESLSNRLAGLQPSYMCDVASTPSAIESALKLAADKLERRKTGKGGTWPLLLIVDEWTSLLRGKLGDLLTATALDYAEQGRKFGCFAMLGAQAWQVDAAGAVRDRLASHYVLRTRGDQFRYQTGLRSTSAPADTLTLQAGQAYMLTVRGDLLKIQIPMMTQADILRLGTLVDKPAAAVGAPFGFTLPATQPLTPVTARRHDGDTMATSAAQVATAPESATTARVLPPDVVRALELLKQGNDLPAIVKDMRGVVPRDGRKYMTALAEVTALIREGMR